MRLPAPASAAWVASDPLELPRCLEKDGVQAAREILARDLGQEKMLTDCVSLGVRDFVVKPFEPQRILSAVAKR